MPTRIFVGTMLALLAFGVFYGDHRIGPPFPFLMAVTLLFGAAAATELVGLIPASRRPNRVIVVFFTVVVLLRHWAVHSDGGDAWHRVVIWFVVGLGLAFFAEMLDFRAPGESLNRIALTIFIVAYVGILGGFLVDLRLHQRDALSGTLALILAVFVPKGCDIGAYFTGSFIGRHKMAPILSPKKTWEGAAGGLATAMLVAVAVQAYQPIIPGGWIGAAGFGLTVGLAGMFGDLAESLIKRDCDAKDAAKVIPGFGGVLDVIDSILFAALVSFVWLAAPLGGPPA